MIITDPIYVVDAIKDVVTKVDIALYNDGLGSKPAFPHIYYLHGHPLDIVSVLQKKVESPDAKDKRFPLIALFQDFRESIGKVPGYYSEVSLNLAIITISRQEYDSAQRYTNILKPVLYPIYYELLKQVELSTAFTMTQYEAPEHDKYDRLYWGKQGLYGNSGNTFNDYVDAIEIQNLKLRVNSINCKPFSN